jgi:hypothetical protein
MERMDERMDECVCSCLVRRSPVPSSTSVVLAREKEGHNEENGNKYLILAQSNRRRGQDAKKNGVDRIAKAAHGTPRMRGKEVLGKGHCKSGRDKRAS